MADRSIRDSRREGNRRARRVRWLLAVGCAVLAAVVLYRVALPLWMQRDVVVAMLYAGRAAYVALVIAAGVGLLVAGGATIRARWRRRPWQPAARWALPAAAILLMVAPIELLASWYHRRAHRLPELPTEFTQSPPNTEAEAPHVRSIVVVGESSARGEPYDVSIAQIAAWQLEKVFPGTRFDVNILARGGLSLEEAILYLADLERRPDAVMIYSGHNEFQARFRWARNVAYYADDDPAGSSSAALRRLAELSPFHRLIDQALERHRLERPPPPRSTRELVDRPAFTAEEYAFLRDDYRMRLDHVLDWSNRIGTLPIVVVPAGNDTDFPPSRSYLDPTTTPGERQRFARGFAAARALDEAGSTAAALDAYRGLIDRQPRFAEAHFRYAQLLRTTGAGTDGHFTRARDLDGMPMRMPSDFQIAARQAARDHNAVLIDAQQVLDADHRSDLFHDGQHPTLAGYVALAQDLLAQLRARHAFGWPDSTPVPTIGLVDCAVHFDLDTEAWARVCRRSSDFYGRIAYIRYDPSPHLGRAAQYNAAAATLDAHRPLDDREGAALGIDPEALRAAATLSHGDATAGAGRVTAVDERGAADQSVPTDAAGSHAPADAAVVEACRKTVSGLSVGDPAALASLPPQTRSALMQDGSLEEVFLCLAAASDNGDYCDQLAPARRQPCAQRWQTMHELKGLPAESIKPQMLYRVCLNDNDKEDCNRVLEAIVAHDATKCADLSAGPQRSFCAALANGDSGECDALADEGARNLCAALATDDPGRCPQEDGRDCRALTRTLATFALAEPGKPEEMDAVAAALRWDKAAFCTPLLAEFERTCVERR